MDLAFEEISVVREKDNAIIGHRVRILAVLQSDRTIVVWEREPWTDQNWLTNDFKEVGKMTQEEFAIKYFAELLEI